MIVHLDQAKILKLPERTATLVVGNPLIADVVVQSGGIVVVTGKGYGATNLIALDRNGAFLWSIRSRWSVRPTRSSWSIRGIERETYSCIADLRAADHARRHGRLLHGQSRTNRRLTSQAQGQRSRKIGL